MPDFRTLKDTIWSEVDRISTLITESISGCHAACDLLRGTATGAMSIPPRSTTIRPTSDGVPYVLELV